MKSLASANAAWNFGLPWARGAGKRSEALLEKGRKRGVRKNQRALGRTSYALFREEGVDAQANHRMEKEHGAEVYKK